VIFFTRHGESEANLADRELRSRPADADRLSELGWQQARGVGERLRGEGIELIVASHYRRAQETAQAISEVLGGLPIETDEDLHEVRQSDAYYAAAPHYGETGTIRWMPAAERSFAEPGAESFDAVHGRVLRVQERLAARPETILCVTHWGFLHFFLGQSLFGEAFGPEHLPTVYRVSHANTGITIFEHREGWDIDGVEFTGWTLVTWNDQAHL
jgi:ribonuclease H / adenosylcobalamin/alpha-ribazole phosphatase